MQTIAHIYTNGLLSNYEKYLNPDLANYPIIILKNNQVVDYCEKAKGKGIKLGMLKRHASYNLPTAVFLTYRNDNYKELMNELVKVLGNFSPRVEIHNDREFFIDLTGEKDIDKMFNSLTKLMVPAYCDGLVLSLAKTKLSARACSLAIANLPKRNRQLQVKLNKIKNNVIQAAVNSNEAEFWATLPIDFIWTLDSKTLQKLHFLGLDTCKQIQEISPGELAGLFGQKSTLIHRYSHGLDYNRVKAIATSGQLVKYYPLEGCCNKLQLEKILQKGAATLADELSVRLEGFREIKLVVIEETGGLKAQTKQFNRILFTYSALESNLELLMKQLKLTIPLSGLLIYLKGIQPVPIKQLKLFNVNAEEKKRKKLQHEKIARVIENLNCKYPAKLKLGKSLHVSRREQMLQIWDPYRFKAEVSILGQTSE